MSDWVLEGHLYRDIEETIWVSEGQTDFTVGKLMYFHSNRGKKKGTQVRWTHYHAIKVGKLDPNIGFQILNATVRTDWSAFYKS